MVSDETRIAFSGIHDKCTVQSERLLAIDVVMRVIKIRGAYLKNVRKSFIPEFISMNS